MHPAVFDINVETLVHNDEITEFNLQIVIYVVHLNTTLLNVVRAQADEKSVASLLHHCLMVSKHEKLKGSCERTK
jgi:hypothetical protein